MKTTRILLFTFLSLGCLLFGCSGMSQGVVGQIDPAVLELAERSPTLENPNVEVIVWGLGCPLCGTNASRSLNMIDGVICKNEVNLSTGQILIYVDPIKKVPTQKVIDAIVHAGFTIKSINPSYQPK